jgi:hypothetical protein
VPVCLLTVPSSMDCRESNREYNGKNVFGQRSYLKFWLVIMSSTSLRRLSLNNPKIIVEISILSTKNLVTN